VSGSLRELQVEHWLVRPEAARQLSLQLQIPQALFLVLRQQRRARLRMGRVQLPAGRPLRAGRQRGLRA
jgi:hypothetical protein